jgi:branched-chain amino acid transport system substrate-binding protein
VGLVAAIMAFVIFGSTAAMAQAQKPIIFALIDPYSGPFKDVGQESGAFVEYAVERINAKGGLLGRQVKVIQYDDQAKPDVAVKMAKRAVLEDGAKVIMSHVSSAVAVALSKAAMDLNVIYVDLHAEADEVTGEDFQPNTFRTCLSTSMHSGILANYFAQTDYERFYLLNQDYAFGHAVSESFTKIFERVKKPGQKIVGNEFHPMATKDFGPYITKALIAKPDVLITGNFAVDLSNMISQGRSLGLKALIGAYYMDSPSALAPLRDTAIGTVTAELYLATAETKANREFLKSWQTWFKAHYPDRPTYYLVPSSLGMSVEGVSFLAQAIDKAQSVDPEKIIRAWEGLTRDGLIGKVTMRACDHQIEAPGFVGRIQAKHAFGDVLKFPYLSEPVVIPASKVSVPPGETGNPRCK